MAPCLVDEAGTTGGIQGPGLAESLSTESPVRRSGAPARSAHGRAAWITATAISAGEALFEQRRADAALPHLIISQRLQPDHLPTLEALGRAYLALGQPAKAISLLERARPLDTGAISFALSSAYRRVGREEEAQAALARYRQLSGATTGTHSRHFPTPFPLRRSNLNL